MTTKGEILPYGLPAAFSLETSSFLIWILTLTKSTGWMKQVAVIPDRPPNAKGRIVSKNLEVELFWAAGWAGEGVGVGGGTWGVGVWDILVEDFMLNF